MQVSYPGVYVQEIASGNHTVTPVATSVAAFVGRAPIGPTDLPVTILSYGDYTRAFGGLSFDHPMSYAVQDFFANGGSQAIICRLFEPNGGSDGLARMRFAGSPPALPMKWDVDADIKAGATTVPVAMTAGAEGEPGIGQTFYVNGDKSQHYTVTQYAGPDPKKKGSAAQMSFLPGLARDVRQCSTLAFSSGPEPQGWSVASTSGNTLTLKGGTGLPGVGDVVTAGRPAQSFMVIADPVVTAANPNAWQVVVTVSPAPQAGGFLIGAASFGPPQPLPMPSGWEIDTLTVDPSTTTGTMTLIPGQNRPMTGDRFTFGTKPDLYSVTRFTPADPKAKTEAKMTFASVSGAPIDPSNCHCCQPAFRRDAAVTGWSLKTPPKPDGTSMTVSGGTGVIDVGYSFQVDADPLVYVVCGVDMSGTVYFLPEANAALAAAKSVSFTPPLQLEAANPGRWGNSLTATVDQTGITDQTVKQFSAYGLTTDDLFNITLTQTDARGRTVKTERFINVSVGTEGDAAGFPDRLDRVLSTRSNLARVATLSALPPQAGSVALGLGGDDGTYLAPGTYIGDQGQKIGLYLLEHVHAFNLLCIPPDLRILPGMPETDLPPAVRQAAAEYCTDRRAFFIVDPPVDWIDAHDQGQLSTIDPSSVGITGGNRDGIAYARNAAVYFPRVVKPDLMMKSQLATFAPCGVVAGIMAATDVGRGVWKAPAGMDTGLAGVSKLEFNLSDGENGLLNPLGINCLRSFPVIGPVVWGARTLRGADAFDDDYKYISIRRLTLFIESSLLRATQWAVFEPNTEALWSSLRLMVSSFLRDLARQGAFYDYLVACDDSTTTPDDVALGRVNILVQIAPVQPAEFIVIEIQQTAGAKPS